MKKIKLHHIIVILIILFVISYIIGRIIIVKQRNDIFKNGQMSICKVYKLHCDGEVDICDGEYFFFYEGKKFFGYYIIEPHNINPVGRYYKVFFFKKKPEKNVVDYSMEINADSICKYFPSGRNPFEAEFKQDSTKRLHSN